MKLNKKVLAVTAILAVGILAGCGSSNSTAGSVASAPASGVESSAASSEAAGETGDVLPIDAGDLNEIKTGSYKFAASITKVADGQATLSVYGYDSYLPEDIDALQEGSVLRIHDQGDTTVTKLTVTSIDRDADNGYVTINGGIEAGGVELTLDHDVYRTVTFDDYPVYYEMGEVTLPLAGGVTLSDSSADPQASAVETDGADAVAEAVNAEPDGWTPNNTLVFTEDGTISSIVRNDTNTFGNRSAYSINNITVTSDILKDYSKMALTTRDGADDYDLAKDLVNIFNDKTLHYNGGLHGLTFEEFYETMTLDVATTGKIYKSMADNESKLASQLDDKRQEVMGVSSDEELGSMIKYQQAYNAASRYVNVVSDMIETLINRTGAR